MATFLTILLVFVFILVVLLYKVIGNKNKNKNIDKVTISPTTIITLYVPYGKLDEDKLDFNSIYRLHLNHDTNNYEIRLSPFVGKLTISEVKKIADEYHATSYRMGYHQEFY